MNLPNENELTPPDQAKDFLDPGIGNQGDDVVDSKGVTGEEIRALKFDAEMAREQLKRLISDNTARKKFSFWIFVITVLWMFSVLAIVILCGRGAFQLSDGVLVALITTTTANVFGFFYVVVNYLFNKSKST